MKESMGKTVMGRVPRGDLDRSVQSSAESRPPVIAQRRSDLTQPESYVASQIASLSPSVSEGPWRMLCFMYVWAPVSSMDPLQLHVVCSALGLTCCHHLRWMADQYRHSEWSSDKQLMSQRKKHFLQVAPFSEVLLKLL